MPVPEITFLILHSPFIIINIALIVTSEKSALAKRVFLFILLAYVVTAFSYYLDLGDGFAIFHYWSMYIVTPVVFCMLKLDDVDDQFSGVFVKVFGFLFVLVISALVSIMLSLLYDPPKF